MTFQTQIQALSRFLQQIPGFAYLQIKFMATSRPGMENCTIHGCGNSLQAEMVKYAPITGGELL